MIRGKGGKSNPSNLWRAMTWLLTSAWLSIVAFVYTFYLIKTGTFSKTSLKLFLTEVGNITFTDSIVYLEWFWHDTPIIMRKNKVITLLYSCWKLFFLFLQTHINTHVCIHICTQSGSFPLYYASGEGHDGIVKILLQKGATVDMQTKVGIVCVASILDPPKKTHPHPPTQMHTQAYGKVL